MLGLHVMLAAPGAPTAFTMANSAPVRIELAEDRLHIDDAWFAWEEQEHDVTLAIRGSSCYCASCP